MSASTPLERAVASAPSPVTASLFRWVGKGTLAIVDQALYAGANFAINIFLARFLLPAQYGSFAVAYSVLIFFFVVHTALVSEPMTIFASGKYGHQSSGYFALILRSHVRLIMPAVGLFTLAVAGLIASASSSPVGRLFAAMAISGPCILLLWTVRRMEYVRSSPAWAAFGSGIFFLSLLSTVAILHRIGRLSPATAILAMGIAGILGATGPLLRMPPRFSDRNPLPGSAAILLEHWRYGRWALASAGCIWLSTNVYYIVLAGSHGLREAANLRALLNFANPALHSLIALSLVLLPTLTRRRQLGWQTMRQAASLALVVFAAGISLYSLLLWVGRVRLFDLLYAGRYADQSSGVALLSILMIAASFTAVLGSILRALERPDLLFVAYLASGAFAAIVGIPLSWFMGSEGALWAITFSYLIATLAMLLMVIRAKTIETRRGSSQQGGSAVVARVPEWLIIGHYGGQNTGDEAMLGGLLLQAGSVPGLLRIVSKDGQDAWLRGLENCAPLSFVQMRFWPVLRAILASDAVLVGGGTHFHDDYVGWRWLRHFRYMARFVAVVTCSKLLKRRVLWLGVGFGPIILRPTKWLTRLALSCSDFVTVRDASSATEIANWIPAKKLESTFDLAALLARHLPERSLSGQRSKPVLGISVISHLKSRKAESGKQLFWRHFDQALANVVKTSDVQVRLFVIRGGNREDDLAASEHLHEILHAVAPDRVEIVHYQADPRQTLAQIAKCDAFIATRLHAGILAYLAGCRLMLLEYHAKVGNFAQEVGLSDGACIDITKAISPDQLAQRMMSLIRDSGWGKASLPISEAIARSRRNVEVVRTLLA